MAPISSLALEPTDKVNLEIYIKASLDTGNLRRPLVVLREVHGQSVLERRVGQGC